LFPDLVGFRPIPAGLVVDWRFLFDHADAPAVEPAKRIDGTVPRALLELPVEITGDVEVDAFHSLASRDLLRGEAIGLPSGEEVARHVGAEPLSADEVGLASRGWDNETPLWYYVLREAAVREGGERLGPIGGRIVAEVLVGIITADPESYLAIDPQWEPTLPAAGDTFSISDLLAR
jgi:hypothetical protein